jgi:hypothetical protein
MDRPVPQISLKDQRERTVRTLCEHFAHDNLEVEEFESRLDAAHRARAHEELAALVQDLPALRPRAAPADATRISGATGPEAVRRAREQRSRQLEPVREGRTVVAIMSGVERRGAWEPGRRNTVIALMGGVELDFREVALPPGETEVVVICMMGGVELIVPPDLHVDSSGLAIMGGFEHRSPAPRPDADAPVLRVQGFCLMGGVEIHERHPGESAKQARLRRREEQRLARSRRRLGGME